MIFLAADGDWLPAANFTLVEKITLWSRRVLHNDLKCYLKNVTKGEVVNDDPPSDVIVVDPESFIKFAIRDLEVA